MSLVSKVSLSDRWVKAVTLMFGVGLALCGLGLALRDVDWKVARSSFVKADWRWIVPTVLCILLLVFVRAMRWRLLFPKEAPPYWDLYFALLGGQVTDTLFFARAGDVARIYLQRSTGRFTAAVTILTEKLLDTLVVITIGSFAVVALLGNDSGMIPWSRMLMALLCAMGLVLAALIIRAKDWQEILLRKESQKLIANHIRRTLQTVCRDLRLHIDLLTERRKVGGLVLVTLLIWLGGALVNYLLFRAFHFPLNFGVAILLLVVLIFGTALPLVPGRIGVFHFLCILLLSAYSIDNSRALSYAVLLHLIVFGTPLALFVVSLCVAGCVRNRVGASGFTLARHPAEVRVSSSSEGRI